MDRNSYLIALSAREHTDFGRVDFGDQSLEQRVFSAVWAVDGAVHMDGFASYFRGYDGESASFAPEALERIGAFRAASIVRRAASIVSDEPLPADQHARERLVSALDDAQLQELDALDGEFYSRPDDITKMLFVFVAARPELFGEIGE